MSKQERVAEETARGPESGELTGDERAEFDRLKEYNATLVATRDQARYDRSAAIESAEASCFEVARLEKALSLKFDEVVCAHRDAKALQAERDTLRWVVKQLCPYPEG